MRQADKRLTELELELLQAEMECAEAEVAEATMRDGSGKSCSSFTVVQARRKACSRS